MLILAVVGISGCTDSSDYTTTEPNNTTAEPTSTQTEPVSPTDTSSSISDSSKPESTSTDSSYGTYIASVNSDVFHHSWCHYVDRIKDYNKIYFSSREEAIAAGYRPCEICNP